MSKADKKNKLDGVVTVSAVVVILLASPVWVPIYGGIKGCQYLHKKRKAAQENRKIRRELREISKEMEEEVETQKEKKYLEQQKMVLKRVFGNLPMTSSATIKEEQQYFDNTPADTGSITPNTTYPAPAKNERFSRDKDMITTERRLSIG